VESVSSSAASKNDTLETSFSTGGVFPDFDRTEAKFLLR
jgi:hypothetical protein